MVRQPISERLGLSPNADSHNERVREAAAVTHGLDPSASWPMIRRVKDTLDRRDAATAAGLRPTASWAEIVRHYTGQKTQ